MGNSLPVVGTLGLTVGRGFGETFTFRELLLLELNAVFPESVGVVVLPVERIGELILLADAPESAPLPVEDVLAILDSCCSWDG